MRAIVVNSPGGPERMELVDFEPPTLGEAEALVAVEAAGGNFHAIHHRSGGNLGSSQRCEGRGVRGVREQSIARIPDDVPVETREHLLRRLLGQ